MKHYAWTDETQTKRKRRRLGVCRIIRCKRHRKDKHDAHPVAKKYNKTKKCDFYPVHSCSLIRLWRRRPSSDFLLAWEKHSGLDWSAALAPASTVRARARASSHPGGVAATSIEKRLSLVTPCRWLDSGVSSVNLGRRSQWS